MRILLVEDDELLGDGIKTALTHFSYVVDWTTKGNEALSMLRSTEYNLMILDLGLPDIDGINVLKKTRESKAQGSADIPILVLTARDHIDDKVAGLDVGADDYMVKPFDIRELEARIRTLTRRSEGRRTDEVCVGNAVLDINQRVLVFNGENITFSRREFSLIEAFFGSPNQVFTRENLENISYSWDDEIESNSLEVHIHRLRKKLGSDAIKTVRGVGYRLSEDHFS